jgi:hypothetical protein
MTAVNSVDVLDAVGATQTVRTLLGPNAYFDVALTPTITAGAYTAGYIMGGLLTFDNVALNNGDVVELNEIQVDFKSAVVPLLRAIIFLDNPTNTTTTDHTAYSLSVSDFALIRRVLVINVASTHGTPRSGSSGELNLVYRCSASTKKLYMLLIDDTGVTPTGTSDLSVRICGRRGGA